MNQTTIRRRQLRDLAKRIAGARAAMVRQTTDRESVIGRDGAAHPRSIRASRELNRTQSAVRALTVAYQRRRREDTPDGQ